MDLLAFDSPIETNVDCTNLDSNYFKNLSVQGVIKPCRLSCITFNARSLRGSFSRVKAFLNMLDYDFTVIVVTETWLVDDIDHGFDLEGYSSVNLYRNGSGGGIKIYVRECLNYSIVENLTRLFPSHESLTVKINIPCCENVFVCAIYRPPDLRVGSFIEWLEPNLNFFENSKCLLLGDLNLNLLNSHKPKIREFSNLMSTFNFVNFITKPTCINPQSGIPASLLDHIWSNGLFDSSSFVFDDRISDHLPCALVSNIDTRKSINKIKLKFRNFSRTNKEIFKAGADNLFHNFVMSNSNVNDATEQLVNKINSITSDYFPIKSKSVSQKRFDMPWLTPSICKCINIKNKCLIALRSGEMTYGLFKVYSRLLDLLLHLAEVNYFKTKFTRNKGNPKDTWRTINSLTGRNKGKLSNSFLIDGNSSSDPVRIADAFNQYFIDIPYKIQTNLPSSSEPYLNDVDCTPQSFFVVPIVSDEVISVLKKLKSGDNLNDIPVKMLKLAPHVFANQLTILFNLCIEHGKYPDLLKTAKIQPIYKSGKHNAIENHRPISILPVLDKIFEKLLYSRIYSFVSKYNLLAHNQYGFRRGLSTSHATLKLLEDVLPAFSQNSFSASIFIDFKKAFDTVNHVILLQKLNKMGFRGVSNDLLRSFLSNRRQYVAFSSASSPPLPVTVGVPQGSCLGPLLYNLYVNDLHTCFNNLKIVMYADDTVITKCDNDLPDLELFLNYYLNKIFHWCLRNKLVINADKTKWMLFTNKSPTTFPELHINNIPLERASNFKYLGFTMDSKCSFRSHIENVNSKLSKIAGLAYRIAKYLTIEVALSLYYSLAHSILNYGIAVWGGVLVLSNNSRLQRSQNKILRNLFRVHFPELSTNELYKKLKILSVTQLYKLNLAITMFKILKLNQHPFILVEIQSLLSCHKYPTRSRNNLKVPFPRVSAIRHNFLFQGITTWNSIPICLKEERSLSGFTRKCKFYFLS